MAAELTVAERVGCNRMGFLGGSDVAAVLGISPWKTAYQLWLEKTGEMVSDDSENGEAKKWGKKLEGPVMEMIEEEWGITVGRRNVIHVHPEHSWARAEVDFEWTDDDGATQNGDVKTSHWRKAMDWGTPWTDEIPAYYACQFLWGQWVSNRNHTLCATLLGVGELRPYVIDWDDELGNYIVQECISFWQNNVLAGYPPAMTTTEDAARAISRFDGMTIAVTEEVREAVARIKGIQAAQKRLEALEARFKLDIQLQMAVASKCLEIEPGKFAVIDENAQAVVTWNTVHRKGYLVKPTTYRTMRIK